MLDHETKYPHDAIALRFCKIVAHMQMKQYKAASDELDLIGDFDSLKNSYHQESLAHGLDILLSSARLSQRLSSCCADT